MSHYLKKAILGIFVISGFLICQWSPTQAADGLMQAPKLPEGSIILEDEEEFGYRGRLGTFALPPSQAGIYFDAKVYYEAAEADTWPTGKSVKMIYKTEKVGKSFCGSYIVLLADLSEYKTISFMIKGETGGESFELGLNDVIANTREDAVIVGGIHRYLPDGLSTEWQQVNIPLKDFYGVSMSKVYSLVFHFNEAGCGTFWLDDLKFHKEELVNRESKIKEAGFLLLDNFDHANEVNLLGRKTGTYKKLPSVVKKKYTRDVFYGDGGRSLELIYAKEARGWCGYYTLLNQIDGELYDLSDYESVSFMVKGDKGSEAFEIGMADENWLIIGDSVKAGNIDDYLPRGVNTQWQEVIIPLDDFSGLDFSRMGSLVINFNKQQTGTIYIDDIKFNLKQKEKKEE